MEEEYLFQKERKYTIVKFILMKLVIQVVEFPLVQMEEFTIHI